MPRLIAIVTVVALAPCAARAEAPSRIEWGIHAAATAVLVMDISTSLDIKNHQKDMQHDGTFISNFETNLILGTHPSDAALVGYGAGIIAVHTALWYALPRRYRWITDVALVVIEVPCVVGNRNIGLSFQIPFT